LTPTNTLALLLPHLSLFAPEILALLRTHYEQYGAIAHWAPVKGFGRVIIVYKDEESAAEAKKDGDRLELDVNAKGKSRGQTTDGKKVGEESSSRAKEESVMQVKADGSYFAPQKRKKSGPTSNRYVHLSITAVELIEIVSYSASLRFRVHHSTSIPL
jgi:hypothetical protein